MCRDRNHGGRRCPLDYRQAQANRDAQKRSYQRKKARGKIAELAAAGVHAVDDLHMAPAYHYGHRVDLTAFAAGTTLDDQPSPTRCKPTVAVWTAPGQPQPDGSVRTEWTEHLGHEGSLPRPGQPPSLYMDLPPAPGQILTYTSAYDDGPPALVEVLSFHPRYDGVNDSITYRRCDNGQVENLDLDHNDYGEFTYPPQTPPAAVQPSEDFAERWKADNGDGHVTAARNSVQRALNGQPVTENDLDAVRTVRAVAAADPDVTPLHRGLWIHPSERQQFLDSVQADGYTVPLGSFTTSQSVARDFAYGIDSRPEHRSPTNAVLVETVGPTRSADLWEGSDEPERVSGGQFTYVDHTTDEDGVLHVRVRQTWVGTPEAPTPAAVRLPQKQVFTVQPHPGAVIAQVDSLDHLRALADRYPRADGTPGVSFDAMRANGIDGLHLSAAGLRAVKSSDGWDDPTAHTFNGWDLESTAWLSPERLKVSAPAPVAPEPDPGWDSGWEGEPDGLEHEPLLADDEDDPEYQDLLAVLRSRL